jgi:hypothetical protein
MTTSTTTATVRLEMTTSTTTATVEVRLEMTTSTTTATVEVRLEMTTSTTTATVEEDADVQYENVLREAGRVILRACHARVSCSHLRWWRVQRPVAKRARLSTAFLG